MKNASTNARLHHVVCVGVHQARWQEVESRSVHARFHLLYKSIISFEDSHQSPKRAFRVEAQERPIFLPHHMQRTAESEAGLT